MRKYSQTLAHELGSVSMRYRSPWQGVEQPQLPGRRLCGWLASQRGSESRVVSSSGRERRIQRLESVLFLAREPLSSRKLSQYANLADGTEARTLIRRLNTIYDQEGRAFHVVEVAGGFQLLTRPQFAPWLRRLGIVPTEVRLSAPAMETLAVVAYRQPVLRVDVEAVRGVACGEILRQLMDRDLVRISGRSEELGRPYLYSTAKRFQQLFGLRNLDELPRRGILDGEISTVLTNDEELQTEDPHDSISEEECEVTVTGNMELHQDETFQTPATFANAEVVDPAQVDIVANDDDDDDDEEYDDDEDLDDEEYEDEEYEDDDDLDDDDDDDDEDEYEEEEDGEEDGEEYEEDDEDEWEEVDDDDDDEEDDDEEFEGDEWEEVDDDEEYDDDDEEEWEDEVDDDD